MAEIDDVVVWTLKSITLTTLLKTVERHASLGVEAAATISEAWYYSPDRGQILLSIHSVAPT